MMIGLERQLQKSGEMLEMTRAERDMAREEAVENKAVTDDAKAEQESLREQLDKVNKILDLTREERDAALEEGEQAISVSTDLNAETEDLQRRLSMRELELETSNKYLKMAKDTETANAEKLAKMEKQLDLVQSELEQAIDQKEY